MKLIINHRCFSSIIKYTSAATNTSYSTRAILSSMSRLEALRHRLKVEDVNMDDMDYSNRRINKDESSLSSLSSSLAAASSYSVVKDQQQQHVVINSVDSIRNMIEKIRESRSEFSKKNMNMNMLTDRFNRHHSYLRISLSERCNLRCLYCMPPDGVPLQADEKLLGASEIQRIVDMFVASGVNKVRLTGGEPLLRKDLKDIIAGISQHKPHIKSVGITTNGISLSRHIKNLVDAGMTHANISLDTLQEDKFEQITRRRGLSKVLRAVDDATKYLCPPHPSNESTGKLKINCVVMKGFNETELKDFVMEFTKNRPIDMRFIEWMPFNDNGWNANRFISYKDMLQRLEDDNVSLIRDKISESKNDTTKWYKVPGHMGRIGFITSMSEHFCGTCNRLRVTADGQLKVCLFGSQEISLRDAMRAGINNDDLQLLVHAAVQKKKFALGGHGDMHGIREANDNRPMTLIGG